MELCTPLHDRSNVQVYKVIYFQSSHANLFFKDEGSKQFKYFCNAKFAEKNNNLIFTYFSKIGLQSLVILRHKIFKNFQKTVFIHSKKYCRVLVFRNYFLCRIAQQPQFCQPEPVVAHLQTDCDLDMMQSPFPIKDSVKDEVSRQNSNSEDLRSLKCDAVGLLQIEKLSLDKSDCSNWFFLKEPFKGFRDPRIEAA